MHAGRGPLELGRLDIVRIKLSDSADLRTAVTKVLAVTARRLSVGRMGIWMVTAEGATLQRVLVLSPSADEPEAALLPLGEWPRYSAALFSRRAVAADDAVNDPRTAELAESYLKPHGITSLLHIPVFLEGEVRGIICHEHVGAARAWTTEEVDFATSVGDMLSALLEQAMRLAVEQQLREEDKTAARAHHAMVIARTAAGIGHDVNTLLQVMTMGIEHARMETDKSTRDAVLAALLEDCGRGARIIQQLRDLQGSGGRGADAIDLGLVVSAMMPALATVASARKLEVVVAANATVSATRTDLERIVMNLVSNACDATPTAGSVRVSVSTADAVVTLDVADDGIGLDDAQRAEVFEPYVTTKEGRHSGLGLFIVQTLATRSGAVVSVESPPGGGATFRVAWPAPPNATT